MAKRIRQNESILQQSCVLWFRTAYPQYKDMLFAVPNGGKRSIITAQRLKKEGVVSGVPDLFLSLSRNGWHGFYIEMKTGKNTLTPNQTKFFEQAVKYGYKCEAVYSIDMFIREVNYYLTSKL